MHRTLLSLSKAVALALFCAAAGARAASPVAFPDTYAVNEDTTLSVSAPGVLGNDTDADGSSFTAQIETGPAHGTLALNSNGSFTYRANTNFNGTDSFTYRARENSSRISAPVSVTITIHPINDAPRATNDSYNMVAGAVLNVAGPGVLGNDFDVEGTALNAVLVANASQGSLALNSDGSFNYTPVPGFFGSDSFTYRASDGQAMSSVVTVSLTVAPAAIVVSAPPKNQTNCVGDTAQFSVTASGTALRYQWLKGTTTLSGQTNSSLVLPNINASSAGTYNVRITGATNSITNSATLTVNVPVAATPLTNLTRFAGSIAILSTTPTGGTGPFTYAWLKDGVPMPGQNGSTLTLSNLLVEDSGVYSVVVANLCGSVTNRATLTVATCFPAVDVMLVIDRSGSMVGQPYTDARTACTNFVRNLQFGPTNDMCGLVAYSTNSVLQSRLTNNGAHLEQAIHALPPAMNGTRITYGLTNAMAELFSSRHRSNALPIIVLMSDGLPNSGDSPSNVLYHAQLAKNAGARVFTVGLGEVDQALMAGAASSTNDYFFTTNSSQLAALFDTISTIICRPPTNIVGPSDLAVCMGVNASFNVMASGCEGFTYQWRKGGVNIFGQTNNTFTITNAQPTNAGVYSVVVSAPCRTVTNSATLTVNSPAQITVGLENVVSFRGSNVVLEVVATGTALSYEWRKNGVLLGTESALPLNHLTTEDAGTYCVIVQGALCGGSVTNCATLTISNRAPVAVNDSYTTAEDTGLIITAPGVLANDSDADGDALTATLVTSPAHGTLALNPDGSFTYVPTSNYHGPDSFTYRANDGSSNSNPATVSISVTPVNDVPVANNDAYSVTADTTLNIAAPGVLVNDTDVENTPLSAVLETNPASGTLALNADGSFTYRPNTNFSGSDSFTYRASDGEATSAVATVTITVVPVPILIVTPPTSRTNCPGDTTTFSVTATGTALTYQWLFNNVPLPGVTNRVLAVRNIDATNGGTYCVLVNGAEGGPITNCAELVVFQNTIVTVPPTNLVVCEGATAEFTVGATGTALEYQWSFGETTLTNQTNATLTLLNIGLSAAGNYRVVVDGACGAPVTNTVSLTVNQNVAILTPPASATSFVGSNVTFSVQAIGTGVTYQWFFNGALVGTNSTLPLNNLSTNQAGAYCVVVSGVCGNPLTNCTTLTIQNRAPVAANDSYTTAEDTTLVINAPGVLANDGDIDGDTLTAVLVSNPASGILDFNADGSFSYTPSLHFTGAVSFTYRANDTKLDSELATVIITVTPVNDAPVAVNDSYSINEDTTLTIPALGVLANDSDVDGDPLTAVLVSGVSSGTLNLNPNGGFSFTPSLNFTGVVTFTYRANDSALSSDVATVTISVLPLNDVPVAVNDAYTMNEDTALFITRPGILANDTDPDGDTLSAVLVSDVTHGTLSLSPNGSFSYTPNTNYHGLDVFTYRATDGSLTSALATVTITINATNDLPAAINDDSYTTLEDTTLTVLPRGILTNDIDVDGDVLTALLVSSTTHGTLSLSNNGAFVYTPSLNYTGVDQFTYRATDGALTSGVATVTITVSPVNDTPVALDDSYSVNEDTTLTIFHPGVLGNDSDVDGNPLTSVLVSNVSHGTLVLSNNGAFVYTPSLNYTGVDVFTYRATDGVLTSSVATVTITVLPLNDVPVARDDQYTTAEDTILLVPSPFGVLTNDTDPDGDPLRAVLVSNAAHGFLTLTSFGSIVYLPNTNFVGVDSFTYRAHDGSLTSTIATVTITVTPVNDAPVAVADDFYTTLEDTTLTVPAPGVLANDIDVDGDLLRSLLVTNVAHGTLNLSTNGAFVYTPSLNYTGVDVFAYRATDGVLTSSIALVKITVLPLNDGPVAVNDNYTIAEDDTLTIPTPGILANDSDVDGDPLITLLASNVSHGTLNLSTNGAFVYTPSLNYTGVDVFTYRATDGGLTSALATVTITVTPVNDAPLAVADDFYTTLEDTTLTVPALGVLANDIDVDGEPLRSLLVTNVAHGTLNLSTNGAFIYTPSLNYTGIDMFVYRATDGSLTSGVAVVTITVLPTNDAPVAVADDFYTTLEDTTLTVPALGVLANDIDVDGDPLTTVLVTSVQHGTLNLSANGAFVYTPSLNYTGVDIFTYRATDGALTSGVATVTITVLPVNDPPTNGVSGDFYSTLEDQTLTVAAAGVLGNDGDVDGDPLTAVLVTGVSHGTLTLNPNGAFVYQPAANYFGPDSFTYVASDGLTSSAPALVSITVIPVNDVPSFTGAGDQKVNQNSPAQSVAWASSISAGPANESDQSLAFLVSNDNSSLFSAQPSIASNGILTYTPALNTFGTATVHVKLQDNGGTANGGVDTSGEVVFRIVVNSPPAVSIVSPAEGVGLLFPATFSVIASTSDPDGTVTNVQFLVNGTNFISIAEAPFYFVMTNTVPGSYIFRAIATDNCGLAATSAPVSMDVITNTVVATGPIVLNHQNGLFEQFVTISNRTSETWANGVRLLVLNLDSTNKVWNPTGTNNGVPYIDKVVSVPPRGVVVITVQYYVPNPRTIPNPTLVARPLPFGTPTIAPQIRSVVHAGDAVEFQFTTQSGRFYFIQSTEDLVNWVTQSVPVAGTGGVVTSSQSNAGSHRFHRLLLVP